MAILVPEKSEVRLELEAKYARFVENVAHGRAKRLKADEVSELLRDLGLRDQDLADAARARAAELLAERLERVKDEPRLRAAAEEAKAACVAAEKDGARCESCRHVTKSPEAKAARVAWEKAKRAWAPAGAALDELRTFHVAREMHDEVTAARVGEIGAAEASLDAAKRQKAAKDEIGDVADAQGDGADAARERLAQANDAATAARAAHEKATKRHKDAIAAVEGAMERLLSGPAAPAHSTGVLASVGRALGLSSAPAEAAPKRTNKTKGGGP